MSQLTVWCNSNIYTFRQNVSFSDIIFINEKFNLMQFLVVLVGKGQDSAKQYSRRATDYGVVPGSCRGANL